MVDFEEKCGNCKWWTKAKQDPRQGTCRGGPPTPILVEAQKHPVTNQPVPIWENVWAATAEHERCAMFAHKPVPLVKPS